VVNCQAGVVHRTVWSSPLLSAWSASNRDDFAHADQAKRTVSWAPVLDTWLPRPVRGRAARSASMEPRADDDEGPRRGRAASSLRRPRSYLVGRISSEPDLLVVSFVREGLQCRRGQRQTAVSPRMLRTSKAPGRGARTPEQLRLRPDGLLELNQLRYPGP